jgi:ribose/xylose/arabinose/galactoside ABC-type transport system permease subunit
MGRTAGSIKESEPGYLLEEAPRQRAIAHTPADPVRIGSPMRFLSRTEWQLLGSIVLLAALFSLLFPESFWSAINFVNMGRVAGILLVAAIAQSFALIVGGFDISIGANMGFVGIVAALGMTNGMSVASAALVAVACGTLVGAINGALIAWLRVPPFVTTLGTMTFLGGLANQLSNGGSIAGLPAQLSWLGGRDWGAIPSSVGMAAINLVVAWFILFRTRAGLYIFAIGGSRETARVSGIPVVLYEFIAYTLCGLFAAIAGIMLTSRVSIGQATLGLGYELQSVATAVIGGVAIGGGVGRLFGVLMGVSLLTILNTGLDMGGINQFYQQMVTGLVLIGAVIIASLRGPRRGIAQLLFNTSNFAQRSKNERLGKRNGGNET